MNEFQKRYENYANKDLLKIIEESDYYQPLAVEAAQKELSKREISDLEIESVKQEIFKNKSFVEEKQKRTRNYENKAKSLGIEILETLNPIQNKSLTIDRKINLLVIVFGLTAMYLIFEGLGTFKYLFSTNFTMDNLIIIGHILPGLILLISVFLFWNRRTFGWILLSASFLYFFHKRSSDIWFYNCMVFPRI